jgi:hypothetical protein
MLLLDSVILKTWVQTATLSFYVAGVPRYAKNSILISGHFEKIQDGCL